MNKKKIFVIALSVIMAIVVVSGVIYNKTDFMKTDMQILWKYLKKNSECTNIFNDENVQNLKNRKNNNSFISTSTLNITKQKSNYKIKSETKGVNSSDITTKVDVEYNNNNVLNFKLVKDSNVVAIKMDELANGYIGVKSNNLKELANYVQVQDISNVPDNINWISYIELLYISPGDVKYITDTYSELLKKATDKANYSSERSGVKVNDIFYTANSYKLSLTENEAKQLLKIIYTNLSEDSRTLNSISSKMKLLNIPLKYAGTEELAQYFKKLAEETDKVVATDNPYVEIIVYTENGETLRTSLKLRDGKTIVFVYNREENKIELKQENMTKTYEKESNFNLPIIDSIEKIQCLTATNKFSEDMSTLETSINLKLVDETSVEFNSTTSICDKIEKDDDFEKSKKIIINDLDEKNAKKLYSAILEEITKIKEKKKILIEEINEKG